MESLERNPIAAAVALVFVGLALLHAWWGIRGVSGRNGGSDRAGRSIALPEVDGRPVFQPTPPACFAVAAALATAALLVLWRGGLVSAPLSSEVVTISAVGVGLVFVARAIGDFRLVGFFKRVRGTPFALWDTRLLSPLSLALGLATLWVAVS